MANIIQKKIVTSQLTLTSAIIVSIALWVVCFLIRPISNSIETIGAYALYALIGYLLIVINKLFAIIRLRASFQTVIYLTLISICPIIHSIYEGNIIALCCLVSIFFLFNSFQKEWSAGLLFHAFIFWGIGCILVPKIVWIVPYLLYSCYIFKSLNIRSFVASIFGFSIPIGVYVVYELWNSQGGEIATKIADITKTEGIYFDNSQLPIIVMLIYSFIIFMVSAAHSMLHSMDEKMQTRCYLQFFIVTTTLLFILAFSCISSSVQLLPFIQIGNGLLYGHFSTLTGNKWSNLFFICMLVFIIPVFIINLLY